MRNSVILRKLDIYFVDYILDTIYWFLHYDISPHDTKIIIDKTFEIKVM